MATYSECPSEETDGRKEEPRGMLRSVGVRMLRVGQYLGPRGWRCKTLAALLVTATLLFGVLYMNETQLVTVSRPNPDRDQLLYGPQHPPVSNKSWPVQRPTSHQGDSEVLSKTVASSQRSISHQGDSEALSKTVASSQRSTSHQGDSEALSKTVASSRTLNWTGEAWMAPGNCTPRTNIGFLKSHKCASSAIQNILFRYGLKHNLQFALPEKANYFGGGTHSFMAAMVRSSPYNKLQPNIFAMHTKWNHNEVRKVMPEDTVYFTIVREPTELFKSLFVYYEFQPMTGLTMERYVRDDAMDPPLRQHSVGYNQMAWDFGVSVWKMKNLGAILEMVERAEDQFGLVLVAERMDESLVLLAKYLCWELEDVVVLHLNAVRKQYKQQLSPGALQLLRKRLAPDYLIYRHFAERFERQVKAFGRQRMEEAVGRLQKIKALVVDTCGFVKREAIMLNGDQRPYSYLVDGFVNKGGEECSLYSLPELPFIDRLREKQMKEVEERFGWPPR